MILQGWYWTHNSEIRQKLNTSFLIFIIVKIIKEEGLKTLVVYIVITSPLMICCPHLKIRADKELTFPTSCMSWSCLSCDSVWCRSASCSDVSPSLSARFRLQPSLTSSLTICVCCLSTARCSAVCRFTFCMSILALPCKNKQ